MPHPFSTVAAIRRALTPGTVVRIVNHKRPAASRTTTVHAKTNTVDLVTYGRAAHDGRIVPTHSSWPKKAELRPDPTDPATFHIDQFAHVDPWGKPTSIDTVPFLTITVMDGDHPDALGPHSEHDTTEVTR